MTPRLADSDRTALVATLVAGAMIAQQVGGKAARDAFFLSQFDISALPTMMVVSALVSIGVVRGVMGRRPASLVPWGFAVSGLLLLVEWALAASQPRWAAAALYLHIAVFGSVLISGFWSLVTDRFDPHTARRRMGQIATGATVGAVTGGLLVERIGAALSVTAVFPVLALLHLVCAALVLRLRPPASQQQARPEETAVGLRDGMRVFARLPYLRNLAYLVFAGAVSAALIDYVFKAEVSAYLADGASMMRFFALFYTAIGIVTLVVQSAASRRSLERFGLAGTAASLPAIVVAGSLGMILIPGLAAALVARAGEVVFRSSLFRSGYELFYTPVSRRDKRATKTAIDVLWERLGDVFGGVAVKGLLLLGPVVARSAILALAVVAGGAALWLCRRLHTGYAEALEASLLNRQERAAAGDSGADSSLLQPSQLHSVLFSVEGGIGAASDAVATAISGPADPPGADDPVSRALLDLRSGDTKRVLGALAEEPLNPLLVPQVIQLLGRDEVARAAVRALTPLGDRVAGQLGDALMDPESDFVVRRRVPGVLAHGSERSAGPLISGLDDRRFEVRYRCGRALARLQSRNVEMPLPAESVSTLVLAEIQHNRRILEGRQHLAHPDGSGSEEDVQFEKLLRKRAHRRLAHIFALLALSLPREPLRIAFRGLEADDQHLRGTALEYLDSVLPAEVRGPLWPFLTNEPDEKLPPRPRDEIVEDLMSSSLSMEIKPVEDDDLID
ncbi:MAG: hypothetical protein OES47_13845 [Acidobacteriota bacterium]|nr:hypothetical protein [Acidobacteriota bacterium]